MVMELKSPIRATTSPHLTPSKLSPSCLQYHQKIISHLNKLEMGDQYLSIYV